MARVTTSLFAFNRGIITKTALARVDVERVRLSAEIQENWIPKTQGSMIFRPGLEYLSSSDDFVIDVPFIASTDDTAIMEFTDNLMRIRLDDGLVTSQAVSTVVANGDFEAGDVSWVDLSTNGSFKTIDNGVLRLDAEVKGGEAVATQFVTVNAVDLGIEHTLRIDIRRGPITLRVGSSQGDDDYVRETSLGTGIHSLSFTPYTSFFIEFLTKTQSNKLVNSVQISSGQTLELPTPWGIGDLRNIRTEQSADVVFVACAGYQQRRIERRSPTSWSIVLYQPDNGPFRTGRTANVKLKVDKTVGNVVMRSDGPFFKAAHVGALFRVFNEKTSRSETIGNENAFSEPIRVTGVNTATYNDRNFKITIDGTWSGTLKLSRSYDSNITGYTEFNAYTANLAETEISDEDDNAIVYYRLGFDAGDYTSGVAEINIKYDGDGGYGICRILTVRSTIEATAEVIEPFYDMQFSDNWQEGVWSDYRGWPQDVAFHRGRLWWFGGTRFIGSEPDDFASFDPDTEGDAGYINRTLGTGPVDQINFALSLNRIVVGTAGGEFCIKSTSFDEPLTPANSQATNPSSQGSKAGIPAVKIDNRGVFASRSGRRIFELVSDDGTGDYRPRDLTILAPEITNGATIVGFAVQRQPDTRLHCWLSDGTVIVLTYEPDEDVICWTRITSGYVVNVCVLPSDNEDEVYYRIARTVNGKQSYYLERFAFEDQAIGGQLNLMADSFVKHSGNAVSQATGGHHLEGETVVLWADGAFRGEFVVQNGLFDMGGIYQNYCFGLPYSGRYKSSKLAYGAQAGTALTMRKKVPYLGLIMRNAAIGGIKFGQTFDDMDQLQLVQDHIEYPPEHVFEDYDEPSQPLPGEWDTDARLCLQCDAPNPCEILAGVLSVETNEKV